MLVDEPVSDPNIAPALTVLLAEDHPINQQLISLFLKGKVKKLITVDTGTDAVQVAEQQAFDLILMDIQMPQLDGISAARAIRSGDGPSCDAPIIALTANALKGDRERYLAAGMSGYVSKPIDVGALFRTIHDLTGDPLLGAIIRRRPPSAR